MIAFYDNKPSKLEAVGNGSYIYRWNIVENSQASTAVETTLWQCNEVIVWPPLTSNNVTKAVISELWDGSFEQKLINEYNSAVLDLFEDNETQDHINKYKAFLIERKFIKEMIDDDMKSLS